MWESLMHGLKHSVVWTSQFTPGHIVAWLRPLCGRPFLSVFPAFSTFHVLFFRNQKRCWFFKSQRTIRQATWNNGRPEPSCTDLITTKTPSRNDGCEHNHEYPAGLPPEKMFSPQRVSTVICPDFFMNLTSQPVSSGKYPFRFDPTTSTAQERAEQWGEKRQETRKQSFPVQRLPVLRRPTTSRIWMP